mmetsp:Transcript_32512/g.41891  ORF Transcript_32512/g.41891 Transcript_32512/m.41891 type:complete len:135 (+) Transcript_32512:224-628(+)
MNIVKFATLLAAASKDNNKISMNGQVSFLSAKQDDMSFECLDPALDAMCCIHENGSVGGCVTCIASVFEEMEEEATCESLGNGDFCSDLMSCFEGDSAPCSDDCYDELDAWEQCEGEACPGLCMDSFLSIAAIA